MAERVEPVTLEETVALLRKIPGYKDTLLPQDFVEEVKALFRRYRETAHRAGEACATCGGSGWLNDKGMMWCCKSCMAHKLPVEGEQ